MFFKQQTTLCKTGSVSSEPQHKLIHGFFSNFSVNTEGRLIAFNFKPNVINKFQREIDVLYLLLTDGQISFRFSFTPVMHTNINISKYTPIDLLSLKIFNFTKHFRSAMSTVWMAWRWLNVPYMTPYTRGLKCLHTIKPTNLSLWVALLRYNAKKKKN